MSQPDTETVKKTQTKSPAPVLFMAGGTGGHVFPALACATALQARGIPVHWLGTLKGLEARVIPQAGINISYININGLRGKTKLSRLLAPFRLLQAVYQAAWVMWEFKPRAVLGMGGFASGPGGLVAWVMGIPLYVHEQNALPGVTNQLLSRLATQVMQAFPDTFDANRHAITVGNPLRFDILNIKPVSPHVIHQPLRLLVIGGSLGAKVFNDTVPSALQQMQAEVVLWHQTGRQTETEKRLDHADDRVEVFINDMAAAYQWADLILCRAGAMTVSEIAQVGLPAILVPYPHATDDHQTRNACYLVDADAAILMPQSEFNADSLSKTLDRLCLSPERLQNMAAAARSCAHPDAVKEVISICLNR